MLCGCFPAVRKGQTPVFVCSLYVLLRTFVQVTQDVHRIVCFLCKDNLHYSSCIPPQATRNDLFPYRDSENRPLLDDYR